MRLDRERVARVVAAIPAGCWASYGDVARAAGGTDAHARVLNQLFIRHRIAGAHRVLVDDGSVSRNALGDPAAVRARLDADGVPFAGERASAQARYRPAGAAVGVGRGGFGQSVG